jgi:pimeloyl-ACP methyl ester carboxylesterase
MRFARALLLTAAGIAAAAVVVRGLDAATERRHPPRGRMIPVDGGWLHYVERGRGPAVVLLHGNGGLLDDFVASGLVDRLARRYRVIAFDRPGFGYSDGMPTRSPEAQAELLRRAASALGAQRPVIVGHSSGALVAAAWGLAPTACAGLVLVAGYLSPERERELRMLRVARLPLIGPVLRSVVAPLLARLDLRRIVRTAFAPRPPSAGFLHEVPGGLLVRRTHVDAVVSEGAELPAAARRLVARYGQLQVPTIVLAGGGDRVVDCGTQVSAARRIPSAEVAVIPEAGHMLHHANPDAIVAAVDDIMRRNRGPYVRN